ncbi:hypothetical protein Acr_17g0011470 [Actinidia rufa]|uniref:Uncharacterized protein n=1 Tax=Actinidia rufa TaxID=165716 RepID=A0A7J0G454_9ERIC|nr:hypothetical protein Acr_17g0011470 [Actinidia rufa]
METLRAALGIGTSEADSQKKKNGQESNSGESGDDELIDGRTIGLNDDSKPHKKYAKDEKEDVAIRKNDGGRDRIDELRSHKNQESKGTRRGGGSSDTDSNEKHVKGIRKKHQKANHQSDSESGSDIDTRKKKQKSTRKDNKNRRDYDSDSDHDDGKYEKTHKKDDKKSRRHDSDDSESDDERSRKRHDRKHGRHNRDDSSSDDEKYEQTHKRHDMDDDDSSFDDGSKHKTQKGKQHVKMDKIDDSEYESDMDTIEENKRNQLERKRNLQNASHRREKEVSVLDDRSKIDKRLEKSSRKYDLESNSDKVRKHKKEIIEKCRGRRHDNDDDYSDIYQKTEKSRRSGRHDTDEEDSGGSHDRGSKSDSGSDSDHNKREKRDSIKSLGKSRSGGVDDSSIRGKQSGHGSGVIVKSAVVGNDNRTKEKNASKKDDDGLDTLRKLEELYQSKGDMMMDGSSYGSREMTRGKRKVDDRNQDDQPEAKSRSRNVGKEADRIREQKDPEKNSRLYGLKDEQKREDYSMLSRSGGREDDKTERGGRTHSRDELYRESKRSDRDYEEQQGNRGYNRDEDGNRGKKHRRDEEETYRRNRKDEEQHQHGSRRRGREGEVEHESGRDDRGRYGDSSKRVKYVDSRSGEGRRYDIDKRDDGRTRQ